MRYDSGNLILKEVNMDFSEALKVLKNFNGVQRTGWNGKGMWIELVPATGWARLFGNTTDFENAPFIVMKTADDKYVPWLASQTDILAEDWTIV